MQQLRKSYMNLHNTKHNPLIEQRMSPNPSLLHFLNEHLDLPLTLKLLLVLGIQWGNLSSNDKLAKRRG